MSPDSLGTLLIGALCVALVLYGFVDRRAGLDGASGGSGGYWAWAWTAMLAAGFAAGYGGESLARALTAISPFLMLAGAFSYKRRRGPSWILPAAVVAGAVRGALSWVDSVQAGALLSLAMDPALLLAAGWIVLARRDSERARVPDRLIGVGLLGLSLIEALEAMSRLELPVPYSPWIGWIVVGVPLGTLQLVGSLDALRRQLLRSQEAGRLSERRLSESEQRVRRLTEHSDALIAEFDPELRCTYASPNHVRVLGYEPDELVGLHLHELAVVIGRPITKDDDLEPRAGAASRLGGTHATRLVDREGRERIIETEISPFATSEGMSIMCISRDVGERVRMEVQLRQHQKLESVGVLAGGVAHDFNNLLTGILGSSGVALARLEADHPARPHVALAIESAERAADLTQQLLAYAGKTSFEIRPVDLFRHIGDLAPLLRTVISGPVELRLELADDLPAVMADPAQLDQMIVNLVQNGAESLGETPGRVTLSTARVELSEPLGAQVIGSLGAGTWVSIAVDDTGPGIDLELRDKIFDPFFSSKFDGRGLGLAAVAGAVRTHGGALQLDTAVGRGSTFRIFLRASDRLPEESAVSLATDSTGRGLILVVDDEPVVLRVARAVLEDAGYDVLTAEGGDEALQIFEKHGDDIRLALVDLTMPGVDGRSLVERFRASRPGMSTILMSGWTDKGCTGSSGIDFLRKPFSSGDLAARVRDALAS